MNTTSINTRYVGTSVYGVRMPIITQGADIAHIIADTLTNAAESAYQPVSLNNRDIIGVTESFLARSQGNYVTLDDVASEVSTHFPQGDVAVAFPILSRNRFAKILEGIARGIKGKVFVCLSYPADEVGNPLMEETALYDSDINPYTTTMTEAEFHERFGEYNHPMTGVDYLKMYREIAPNIEIVLLNNPKDILKLTNQVLVASIHARHIHKRMLEAAGATVCTLADICNTPKQGRGWSEYGLLGSNFSDKEKLKLFPHEATTFCRLLQQIIHEKTGKTVEVLVYGDGGFKCPFSKIWEFADPVVAPGYTDGLQGMPNEIKIKAVADNNTDNPEEAIQKAIQNKHKDVGIYDLGTTPRRFTDLIGSLCDLTSGSGDKGTPVIVIKGYFDNYTTDNPTE